MTEPTSTAVVAAGEPQQILPPQVVLIFQDNPDGQTIEIGGAQRPETFDPKSPAHVVGKYIADNLPVLVELARVAATGGVRRQALELLAPTKRDIVVPGSDSLAVAP